MGKSRGTTGCESGRKKMSSRGRAMREVEGHPVAGMGWSGREGCSNGMGQQGRQEEVPTEVGGRRGQGEGEGGPEGERGQLESGSRSRLQLRVYISPVAGRCRWPLDRNDTAAPRRSAQTTC